MMHFSPRLDGAVAVRLAAVALFSLSAASFAKTPTVLAEFPNGTFLENVTQTDRGAIVFTNYFAKTLEILVPGKPARTLATLPAHPVGIVRSKGGFVVSAHGKPFNSGSAFTESQQILILDSAGTVKSAFPVPQAKFLNGLAVHASGALLVADSIAGAIWRIEPTKQKVSTWLEDEALKQDPSIKEFRPGANGLKFFGNSLLVSNSSRGGLFSIPVNRDGNILGAAKRVAKTDSIDDFFVTRSGDIVFATHADQLKRVRATGEIDTLLPSGCDGCTALAPFRNENGVEGLAVLTTGGLLEGGTKPARVLFVPFAP
jgi:sugar lactone lactonase YvrE